MHPAGFFAFTLVIWTTTFLAVECQRATANTSKGVKTMNASMVHSRTTYDDIDDDDFVPYQGERFSVFDWNLCRIMGQRYSGNVLISPISIKLALVLLYEGAQDQTAHELASTMQLPASRSATRDKFSSIIQSLRTKSPLYNVNIGTRLYIDTGVLTRQRYGAIAKVFYDTDVINANLSQARAVIDNVNTWVSNITEGNIRTMVDDEKSVKDSVMLIFNALYFKGTWRRHFFSPNNTRMGKFYTENNRNVEVPFMHTIGRFYYSESAELDAKIIRLPYEGHRYSMYLILPMSLTGLDQLIKDVNPFILARHVWLMQDLPIEVSIPKFKFDFTSHLESILRELGIRDVFDNTATLTGIARTKRTSRHLMVSDVIQKTGIEVNEQGTSAYAVTEIQIGNKIADQTFHADHPFLFYVEDETTGTILYVGKVTNPMESTGTTGFQEIPTRIGDDIPQTLPVTPLAPTREERYNFFNIDLLQAVNDEIDGNVIISPASAKVALTTLLEGTSGRTQQELLTTLRLPADISEIRSIIRRNLLPLKSNINGTEIDVATQLWAASSLTLKNRYVHLIKQFYGADLRFLNFTMPTDAANIINSWVRHATRNKIQSLVEPGSLSTSTRLLITSALYFKGRWMNSFDRTATRIQCFNVPNKGCKNVPFMENVSMYRYAYVPSLDTEVVEIPYSDGRTAMLILLPNNEVGNFNLQILSKDLSYIPMSALLSSLEDVEVHLMIPKFSIETKLDLRPSLMSLGIRDLFDLSANFSRITPEPSIHVSSVLQNARIEVDEEGTVAAAATGLSIVPLMGVTTQMFKADRPFIFAIVDLQTNGTLFAGRLVEPE